MFVVLLFHGTLVLLLVLYHVQLMCKQQKQISVLCRKQMENCSTHMMEVFYSCPSSTVLCIETLHDRAELNRAEPD